MNTKRICILNTLIDSLTMDETLNKVDQYIVDGKPLHLMGVNADKINMLNKNHHLKEIVNSCDIINADGASVVLASRYLKSPLPERVAGIDLMQRLVELAERKGYSVYFLGAKQDVVEKMAQVLQERHPRLKIVGIHNGYFKENQWKEIATLIHKRKPQLVFVGITSPLKEYLVEYLQNSRLNCVFMGVGGSFDVISGMILRAPIWMQKMNLEWLFRVIQEPRRLLKRYFVGNLEFIKNVYLEKYTKKRKQILEDNNSIGNYNVQD